MNAPLTFPVIPAAELPRETATRFPKLTAAEIEARKAADRAIMQQVVREMCLKPGVLGPVHASVNRDRLSFDAWGRWACCATSLRTPSATAPKPALLPSPPPNGADPSTRGPRPRHAQLRRRGQPICWRRRRRHARRGSALRWSHQG
jgi:hypothetical protein